MSENSNNNLLTKYLNEMINDLTISRTDLRTCFETTINIYRNALTDVNKFGRIRTSNLTFRKNVWRHSSIRSFILKSGWIVSTCDGSQVILFNNEELVRNGLKILIDCRFIKPDNEESIQSNKLVLQMRDHLREEELKLKALNEKTTQMKIFEDKKRENEVLVQNIKKEIESDNKYRKLVFNHKK
jgi:hypothetical protein